MFKKIMDLHNHTTWSDGFHAAEEIIENAIRSGVGICGISDHYNTVKCESLSISELDQYIENMRKLKERYRDDIDILIGLELCMHKTLSSPEQLPYNVLNELDYVLFEYIDRFTESITLQEIDVFADKITCHKGMAHTDLFDLADKYGIDKVMRILKDNELFWEINVNQGYGYFDDIIEYESMPEVIQLFDKLREYGIKCTVGSDTHSLAYYDVQRVFQGNELAAAVNRVSCHSYFE